jgi:hypothetical protein
MMPGMAAAPSRRSDVQLHRLRARRARLPATAEASVGAGGKHQLELGAMLKTMFVLVVISGQYYPAPVVISQHSTQERCEQAYKDFTSLIARNTSTPGVTTTVMRTYACVETEIWLPGRVE